MNGSKFFADIPKLKSIADEIIAIGKETIPVDTGNLMDSTGMGIYVNGVLMDFRYDNQASVPRKVKGELIWGKDKLNEALALGASTYSTGVWIVLFSTMPYAIYVNRNTGFFSASLKSNLRHMVLSQFKIK